MSDHRTASSFAARLLIGFTILTLVLPAAGHAKPRAKAKKKEEPELIKLQWPEPPETTRIQFVQTLATKLDLGVEQKRRSFFDKLTGTRPPLDHLYQPMDIAVSDDGKRVYVADFGQLMVFLFDLEAKEVTLIGRQRPFARPFGIALDGEENLYVAEQDSARIVVLDRQRKPIRVIGHESLIRPADIEIDRQTGLLYVADPAHKNTPNHTVKVFDLEGHLLREVGEGKGQCAGCLLFPTYLALDPEGNLYVTNTLNARVDVFDTQGRFRRYFGERGNAFGMFDKPKGVALDQFGNVYVVDSGWSNVQIFNQQAQVLLFFGGRGAYPGLLRNPTAIEIDRNNRIYVADYLNYRVNVYQLVNTTAEDSFRDSASGD
ncbi:MAG: hypothetical protein D6696_16085 [Acidobacteria bacterium]|nr:MAG: hypothetical protein D6696_16085 [Acidobacteriota bacterium]